MKTQTKRRVLLAAVVLIGIPSTLCVIFVAMLVWGLSYGVDPLEAPIESDGVSALIGSQRMGDQRLYVFVENHNKREVAVDLNISVSGDRTDTAQLHTVLGPRSERRIYSGSPKEIFGCVLSLSVTQHYR
jgi:hypothetical protein